MTLINIFYLLTNFEPEYLGSLASCLWAIATIKGITLFSEYLNSIQK